MAEPCNRRLLFPQTWRGLEAFCQSLTQLIFFNEKRI
jgi:hypothetical protein